MPSNGSESGGGHFALGSSPLPDPHQLSQRSGKKGRKNLMNPSIQLKKAIPPFLVALVCFGLSSAVRAVEPPPDGDYGNGNTAEGLDALFSLSGGSGNNK